MMSVSQKENISSATVIKDSNEVYSLCVKGLSLIEYKELLNKYLDIIFPLEDLSDLRLYYEVSKNISKMYFDAKPYRLELADVLIDRDYVIFVVKMMKKLNNMGVFKNDDIWFSSYYMYNINWNFSDATVKYSKELLKFGISNLLIANIGHQPYLENISSKNVCYLVKSSLSILLNIVKCQENDMLIPFKEKNVIGNFLELVKSENDMIKGLSALILAYIIDEEDQAILEKVSGSVNYLISCLQKAMNSSESTKRRFSGFTVEELVQGLTILLVNDNLKTSMDENGIIPLLIQLVSGELVSDEEIIPAIKALWNLSFDKTIKKKLVNNYNLISIMEKSANSINPTIVKLSKGALWTLREENLSHHTVISETSKEIFKTNYVFISYNWRSNEIVKKIREELKKANVNVWIDTENTKDSSFEGIASGIENSTAVIIFMSSSYKRSANCRVEAEYALKLNKPIIPVIVENKYKPNGWLRTILGAKLNYDFSGNCDFNTTFKSMVQNLFETLNVQSKITESNVVSSVAASNNTAHNTNLPNGISSHAIHGKPIPSLPSFPLLPLPTVSPLPEQIEPSEIQIIHKSDAAVLQWTECNIKEWLSQNDLAHLQGTLGKLNGHLLLQLTQIRREAPDYFYSSLEKKWNLDFIDILRLTYALEHL